MFVRVRALREGLEEAVAELDPDGLDGARAARMFEELAAIEQLSGNAKTLVLRRLGQTRGWRGEGDRSFAHYVARKTRTTLAAATGVVKAALRLDPHGATADAMRSGAVSPQQAAAISGAVAADANAERDLLATAAVDTLEGLRSECRRVTAAAEPDPMARHRVVHRNRRAHGYPDAYGAFVVEGRFTPDVGAALWARVEADADALAVAVRKAGGRLEPRAAYRADALANLAAGTTDRQSTKARKVVTVRARVDARPWLTGEFGPGDVCEIVGAGPVPPEVMWHFATDALVYGIVERGTDVSHINKLGGEIPDALRHAVLAHSPECILVNCHETHGLEIDHSQPRARVGPHAIGNLKPLCHHHHVLKTHAGWQLVGSDEGGWNLVPPGDSADRSPPAVDDRAPPDELPFAS